MALKSSLTGFEGHGVTCRSNKEKDIFIPPPSPFTFSKPTPPPLPRPHARVNAVYALDFTLDRAPPPAHQPGFIGREKGSQGYSRNPLLVDHVAGPFDAWAWATQIESVAVSSRSIQITAIPRNRVWL